MYRTIANSAHKSLDEIKELVNKGAKISAKNNKLLRYASKYGRTDIVYYLLQEDVNVHAKYDEALRNSAKYGHLDVVVFLIEHGADDENDEALFNSASYGHVDVMEYLLSLRYDYSQYTDLLNVSIKKGHVDIVSFLIKNKKIDNYNEALFLAIHYGHLDVVSLLLDNGADVNADYDQCDNYYPIDIAIEKNHLGMVRLLLNYGSVTNDKKMFDCVHYGYLKIATLIFKHRASIREYCLLHDCVYFKEYKNVTFLLSVYDAEQIKEIMIRDEMVKTRILEYMLSGKIDMNDKLICFYRELGIDVYDMIEKEK